MTDLVLRDQEPGDADALEALGGQAPDGGSIAFSTQRHVPAAADQDDHSFGVVAQDRATGALLGAARVRLGQCRVGGQLRPYALLGSLAVHAEHRRQGIGAALARWRIERATELQGPETVLVAEIQSGNVASLANARTWAEQFVGRLVVAPVPMRRRPPRPRPDVTVRPVQPGELAEVAERLDVFTADHDLARLHTAETLTAWLAGSPLPDPVNHYLVATDRAGRLLAGMGLREAGRLSSLHVHRMPAAVRLANLALHVVPRDGVMRNLEVDKAWFAPGHAGAARQLWEAARWELRRHSTSLVATYDVTSALRPVLRTPPWMPTTSITMAVRSPVPIEPGRVLEAFGQ